MCARYFVVLVATTDPHPPERKILEAVKLSARQGGCCRVVRQVSELWTLEDLKRYQEVLEASDQVRYLDADEIQLRFAIFGERDVILVLPNREKSAIQENEALRVRLPLLAEVVPLHFEELWEKGEPMLPLLEKAKRKRQKKRKKQKKKSSS
jgi:hypothetical protein